MKPKNLDVGDWNNLVDVYYNESDRGAAVLAGSFVENALRLYLREKIRDQKIADDLFSPVGPLSSFSQCSRIAYAFGFVREEVFRDVELIRRIRNHFAHHPMDATFATPEVLQLAGQLSTANDFRPSDHPEPEGKGARIAYLLACGLRAGSMLTVIGPDREDGPGPA